MYRHGLSLDRTIAIKEASDLLWMRSAKWPIAGTGRIKIMQGIFMHWKIFMRIVRSDNLRFSLFGSRFPNCERDIFFPFKLEVLSVFYQLCGSHDLYNVQGS